MKTLNIIFHPGHKTEGSFDNLNTWKRMIESSMPKEANPEYLIFFPITSKIINASEIYRKDSICTRAACQGFLENDIIDEINLNKGNDNVTYSRDEALNRFFLAYNGKSAASIPNVPQGRYDTKATTLVVPVSNSQEPWFLDSLVEEFEQIIIHDDRQHRWATQDTSVGRKCLRLPIDNNNKADINSCFEDNLLKGYSSFRSVKDTKGVLQYYILEH